MLVVHFSVLRVDRRNLLLIAAGYAAFLALVPPQHEYPIIDDWIYAGSVRDMLQTGKFVMPEWSQANLVGLTAWGAAWAKLLGFSFTTLTYSTLAFSLLALLAFYGLARSVGVGPGGALLALGVVGVDPVFVPLRHSFMAGAPFLALLLVSSFL